MFKGIISSIIIVKYDSNEIFQEDTITTKSLLNSFFLYNT